MQPSEIALTLILMLYAMTQTAHRSALWLYPRTIKLITLAIIFILIAIRLVGTGYSWQFLPLLAVSLIAVIVLFSISAHRRVLRRLSAATILVLTVAALLPLSLFPIADFPKPAGPFLVGTTTLHLTDESRAELYGRNADGPREFMVQLWYPTDIAEGYPRGDYLPNASESAPAIAKRLELPSFILNHTNLLEVNSRVGAPLSPRNKQYPILVFSHGYQSLRGQTTPLMEELASQGYVVASMEHTYGAAVTIFPDGRIEFLDPNTLSGEGAAYDASARKLGEQWQQDIQFFLASVKERQVPPEMNELFDGRIDFTKLGMFGHSTGAGVAMKTCQLEACKAVLGLDAWFGPVSDENLETGSPSPALFLMSELWPKPKNVSRIAKFMKNSKQATWLTILGTGHYDFSDLPFLSPLTYQLGLSGPIDSTRGQQIVTQTTLSFFDQFLMADAHESSDLILPGFEEVVEKKPSELK
jgi:predicted dienelactone hydrolase